MMSDIATNSAIADAEIESRPRWSRRGPPLLRLMTGDSLVLRALARRFFAPCFLRLESVLKYGIQQGRSNFKGRCKQF
jgi:hypothetical protein